MSRGRRVRLCALAFGGALALTSCGSPGNSKVLHPPGDDAGETLPDGDSVDQGPVNPDAPSPDVPNKGQGLEPTDALDSGREPPGDVGPSPPDVPTDTSSPPPDLIGPDVGNCSTAACCKGCWDGVACRPGTDVSACGTAGGACKACDDNNACTADKCMAGVCQADKLTGPTCPTGVCTSGACHCGATGEPCCTQGTACEGSQVCQGGRCGSCGSPGMPCCGGNMCAAGGACNGSGMCEACGGANQLCCASSQCNNGLNCGSGGRCGACGASGQACCTSGNPCQSNLTCGSGNTCQCGGIGQACCGGNSCTDDGNACNGTEVCNGTCQHQSPVVCTALDQCHDVGVCQPGTGTCTNPPRTGSCNDNNLCTSNDTCQNGTCQGTPSVVCSAQDQCHSAGVCQPSTGTCTNPLKTGSCDDGNSCTANDTCSAGGTCQGTPLSCSTGQRCSGGQCVCDSTSCSSGCCSGNTCQPGTTDSYCGSGGGSCNGCSSGSQMCQNHSCAACGGGGQACCTGGQCGGGRSCINNKCLNHVYFDCTIDGDLTGSVLYNTDTGGAGPAGYTRTGRDYMFTNHFYYKMFVTFDCSGNPGKTGLQDAIFSMYQSDYVNIDPNDTIAVRHVTFGSIDYMYFNDPGIDSPGNIGPLNATAEYKTLNVTSSVQSDLNASRAQTQFRLELVTSLLMANKQYVEWHSVGDANLPKLRLHYLLP